MKKVVLIVCALAYMLMCTLSVNAQWVQTNGPYGVIVQCLVASGTNIFAGTDGSGIFLSTDSGSSWISVDSGLASKYITALATIGTNIFAGTIDGVFLSMNNGATWNWAKDSVDVSSFAVSGTNIFAGTLNGVFLSTDTGSTWSSTNSGITGEVQSLAINGTIIVAGTYQEGIFLSTNNGGSWTAINNGLPTDSPFTPYFETPALAISGSNIIAATYGGMFISSDNGASWMPAGPNGGANSFAISGTNILAGGNGVFLSFDNGANWTSTGFIEGTTVYGVFSLTISGTNIFVGTYSEGVWKRSLSDILAAENITADNNSISIYPNPATTQLTIHPVGWSSYGVQTSSLHTNEVVTVSIMNVLGQEALPPTALYMKGEDAVIDVSKLSAGIYFVQMKTESGSVVKRFVKE